MKMNCPAKYLNREPKVGVKDPNKIYYMTLFMQGTDTIQLNAPEQVFNNLEGVPPMANVDLIIDYNAQYKSVKLLEVHLRK